MQRGLIRDPVHDEVDKVHDNDTAGVGAGIPNPWEKDMHSRSSNIAYSRRVWNCCAIATRRDARQGDGDGRSILLFVTDTSVSSHFLYWLCMIRFLTIFCYTLSYINYI